MHLYLDKHIKLTLKHKKSHNMLIAKLGWLRLPVDQRKPLTKPNTSNKVN